MLHNAGNRKLTVNDIELSLRKETSKSSPRETYFFHQDHIKYNKVIIPNFATPFEGHFLSNYPKDRIFRIGQVWVGELSTEEGGEIVVEFYYMKE